MFSWRLGRLGIVSALLLVFTVPAIAQSSLLSIGAIQGSSDVSPYLNRFVNFRGVVVGRYEDVNTRGDVYYTLFVQDLPDTADGDPATSDGIAVFLGREPRPDIPLGAQVLAGGKVTEFYGLTEIDDNGLVLTMEEPDGSFHAPIPIDPPADMAEQAAYFEALEGMRVAYDGPVVVSGPTHTGCGFAVVGEAAAGELPAVRQLGDDPVGRVVPILYPSDLKCAGIPQVKTGDRLTGMAGALTYNFDQFKIIIDSADQLTIEPAEMPVVPTLNEFGPDQIVLASINVEDYFDTVRNTEEDGEPVLTVADLAARQTKLAHVMSRVLNCPTLIAIQEVEHERLLGDLSAAMVEACGFAYQVSHLNSPDARGIDNALLSDPRRVEVGSVSLRQICSPVPTGITDRSITCETGHEPLFGRPPLQVEVRVNGDAYVIFVNHFKSKRDGEIETDLERIQQAVFLNGLAAEILAGDPDARLIALGDFNDTNQSPALTLLTDPAQGGRFTNALATIPPKERFTYNFGGVVELIDAILLSPALVEDIGWATILHTNTDFPVGWRLDTSPGRIAFRSSDHDFPVIALGQMPEPTAEPTAVLPTVRAAERPTSVPATEPAVPQATAEPAVHTQQPAGTPTAAPGGSSSTADPSPTRDTILFWVAMLFGIGVVAYGVFLVSRRR